MLWEKDDDAAIFDYTWMYICICKYYNSTGDGSRWIYTLYTLKLSAKHLIKLESVSRSVALSVRSQEFLSIYSRKEPQVRTKFLVLYIRAFSVYGVWSFKFVASAENSIDENKTSKKKEGNKNWIRDYKNI